MHCISQNPTLHLIQLSGSKFIVVLQKTCFWIVIEDTDTYIPNNSQCSKCQSKTKGGKKNPVFVANVHN